MSVQALLNFSLKLSQFGTPSFGETPAWRATMSYNKTFKNGTAANKYDRQYLAERTVASGATDAIDLTGVLQDAYGTTITAAKLVGIAIINEAADGTQNTTSLTIGGGSNAVPGFGTALDAIEPGGSFIQISPGANGLAAITAGTGDIIRVVNGSGASAKYQIALLMRSA